MCQVLWWVELGMSDGLKVCPSKASTGDHAVLCAGEAG